MKILNALILVIYAIVLSVFLSYSAKAATGTTYGVQLMAAQKQLQTTDAVFKGVTDIHEETFTTGPVKYKYTTGWTNSWTEVKATWQKMIDAGFTGAFIVTYTEGNRVVKNTTNTTDNNTATTTTTTTTTDATPNMTRGTTIFTMPGGKSVSMTTKKTTTADGKAQYETTTTTGPASTNPWNTMTTPATTTDTKTTTNGNTVTMTTKKVTKTTTWVNPDGTTTTTSPTETNTNPDNTTETTAATTTPTHVYRGYGEKLAQTEPTFPGGDDGLYVWIRNNLSYVLQTQSTGEWKHGNLVFTVDRTGKAINPMMMTGITKEVDAAAIKMIKDMPNWNPATVAGNPVDKQFIMPLDCFIPAPVPVTSTK